LNYTEVLGKAEFFRAIGQIDEAIEEVKAYIEKHPDPGSEPYRFWLALVRSAGLDENPVRQAFFDRYGVVLCDG
jgi:hypothetical protein